MRDILFMSGILASVTHEMQNVMAIIKESGALADDILKINGPPRMKHGDKLETAFTNIQEQVQRGRDLMLMLNGFAHAAADYPESGDLARFARHVCTLAQRTARLKECSLTSDLESVSLLVRGNALLLMQSIHAGLAAVLENCAAGDVLRLGLAPSEDGAALRISAETSAATPDSRDAASLMAELGGDCRAGQGFLELRYQSAPPQGEAGS